ncbi:MAG: T9SS type A sorting domain-containing protein [Chitinophagaceae bacterium]
MKNIKFYATAALLLSACYMQAQVNLQNTGTLYISGSSDILYVNGSLANSSAGALTNNGSLYVLQDLANDQASMAIGTGTLYLNGTALQTLSGSQLFRTFNLVTNNSSGFTLNNDLSVSGAHTFTAGVITTSATPNYLMYEAGSSYSGDGDSKHVKGWVRKTGTTSFAFPLGNGTVERTIAANSPSISSVFNATYSGTTPNTSNIAPPLVTVDRYEYWTVNRVSGGTAIIAMNWDNSKVTMPPYTLADIRVANYTGGLWTSVGGSATGNVTTTGNIASPALSSFGQFVLGSVSFALPVNLLSFTAYKDNGNAIVSWSTSDEINVNRYEVQRSDDGLQFYTIGTVAARNLASLQQYAYTDTKELAATTYYRLRSVDNDGQAKFSAVVLLKNSSTGDARLSIVNPAHDNIHIAAKNINGLFEYRINTIAGQTIQRGLITINAASASDINLSGAVKNGVYILQLQKPGFSFSQKVLVE